MATATAIATTAIESFGSFETFGPFGPFPFCRSSRAAFERSERAERLERSERSLLGGPADWNLQLDSTAVPDDLDVRGAAHGCVLDHSCQRAAVGDRRAVEADHDVAG